MNMPKKNVLIALCHDEVSPRFDMSVEALIAPLSPPEARNGAMGLPERDGGEDRDVVERRHLVLAHVSGEELCDVVVRSGVSVVVCGAIEEDYYHYLRWKRIEVICDVIGPVEDVLERLSKGLLQSGDSLYTRVSER